MNWVSTARDKFAFHYFDWCVGQIHLAANDNFQTVRRIQGYYSGIFADFVDAYGASEGASLCLARLKKFNPRVLELRGETVSTSDLASIARFTEFTRIGGTVMRMPKSGRKLLLGMDVTSMEKLGITELRRVLAENLSTPLGAPISRGAREFLEFRTSVRDWIVFTNITAEEDNTGWALRYSHTISARSNLDAELIGASISYLAWLGLPTTEWNSVSKEDLYPIASSLRSFIDIFMCAAPALLKGIENPLKIV